MTRNLYTLVLNLAASVRNSDERFEFEPLSWWIKQDDGTSNVHQRVYIESGRFVGESGKYEESVLDVVRDFDRFVSLTPIKE